MKLKRIAATALVAMLAVTGLPVSIKAADGVPVDEAHFPDENFRAWVSEKCDTDGDGSLSDWEIMMTTGIDVGCVDINTLKGIEYFTALTDLNCYFNELTTLDVSKNTALESLYCAVNGLTTLNVSECTALTNLSCYGNQLTALDASGCTALERLDCSINQLTDLDLSSNVNLETFYGEGNQFTEVNVSALTNLKKYDGTLDTERKVLVYGVSDLPEITPDKTIKVGKKTTLKTKKTIKKVKVSESGIVKVKKKGKKIIVKGKSAGIVTITAYNKKGKVIKSWVVKVK